MIPIRPNVLQMEPYAPGKPAAEVTRELGIAPVVKLASNENPLGPSPKAIEAVCQAAARMNVYPDASGYELKQAISETFGVDYESVLIGNGSDELIHMLGLVFLDDPKDEVVVGDPSFVRYDAAAALAPARLIRVPLDAQYRFDLQAMTDALDQRTKMVFLANPNNPTGTVFDQSALERFLAAVPESAVVVLDEAYYEFARSAVGYPDSVALIRERPNLISLRTFSKAYGLAGIRIGFGFAHPAVVDAFNRAREPFNVNALAQAAAIAALKDSDHVAKTIQNNRRGLDRVSRALASAGAKPVPSSANFVFADFGRPAAPIVQALMREGVVIRSGEMFGTPNCVRVSVGSEAEVDRFVVALESVVKESAIR